MVRNTKENKGCTVDTSDNNNNISHMEKWKSLPKSSIRYV